MTLQVFVGEHAWGVSVLEWDVGVGVDLHDVILRYTRRDGERGRHVLHKTDSPLLARRLVAEIVRVFETAPSDRRVVTLRLPHLIEVATRAAANVEAGLCPG